MDGKPLGKPCAPEPCTFTPAKAVAPGDPLRMALEAMDRHNIVLGFLSDELDDVFAWTAAAPGRFIASPLIVDPAAVDTARLEREYAAGRLAGMGEIAAQYEDIAPNDPGLGPFYALAERFDVPLVIHTAGGGAPSERFRIRRAIRNGSRTWCSDIRSCGCTSRTPVVSTSRDDRADVSLPPGLRRPVDHLVDHPAVVVYRQHSDDAVGGRIRALPLISGTLEYRLSSFALAARDSVLTLCDGTDRGFASFDDGEVAGANVMQSDSLNIQCFNNGLSLALQVRYELISNGLMAEHTTMDGAPVGTIVLHRVSWD